MISIREVGLAMVLIGVLEVESLAARPALATPESSTEAVQLYDFLLDVSGRHTLSGQHCVPLLGSTRLPAAQRLVGQYPAVFSQDFGFSAPGTWDGINYRQQIVDEAIRRHEEGFIINLMWHAVRPIEEEPVEFESSVQGKLSDDEWRALLTPGTRINERWKSQVDVIAFFLRQLRDARVPVLWRPYHEMNGAWFWWGGNPERFQRLYRMLYERLVTFHGLKNLIWVFGGNEIRGGVDDYAPYFPGHDVVDALATDVYQSGFVRKDYDALLELAEGKPIGLGEVGPVPPLEILQEQPRWAWFVVWGDLHGAGKDRDAIKRTYQSAEVLNREELPGVKITRPVVHHPIIR